MSGGGSVSVRVEMPDEIVVRALSQAGDQGLSEDAVLEAVKSHRRELARLLGDDIADFFSDWLPRILGNMTLKGAL